MNIVLLFLVFSGVGLLFNRFNNPNQSNWQKNLGESFFIGVFFIIIIINIAQFFSLEINQSYFFKGVLLVSSISYIFYIYIQKDNITRIITTKTKPNYYVLLFIIFLCFHLYTIIKANQQLPLTPWDSWVAWIAKAKIWFFYGINEELVTKSSWFLSENNLTNPTVHYPDALPLLYVFNTGFFGWNETSLNAIYPAMFMAFLLAFYGNIKLLINQNYAIIAVIVLISIPLINVHITLAGYSDFWVASFLVLAVFNLQLYIQRPSFYLFILLLIFTISLVMFKMISWVWVLILFLVLAIIFAEYSKRKWLYLALLVFTAIWFYLGGFSYNTPLGELEIAPDLIKVPALGVYKLKFMNTTSSWVESLFISKNWNFLWFSIPFVVYMYSKIKDKSMVAMPALYLVLSVLFLFVLFYMTLNSVFASDFTSSNRVVLHIVPLYIYFACQVYFQYQKQKSPINNKALHVDVGDIF